MGAAACWGFSNVFTKILLAYFEPLSLLAIQLIVSNIAIWFFAFKTKSKLPARGSLKYSWPGLLQPGMVFILGTFGLNLTTANSGALIWATEIIVVVFLATLLLRENISWYLWMLAICGTGGTLLATMADFNWQATGNSMLFGNILILAGVICAAFYNIYTHRQLTDIEPLYLTALHQLSGLILVISIWLCFPHTSNWPTKLDISLFLFALLGGILQYALPYFLYLNAIKELGAARASILLALLPAFTICGSFFLLNERLNYYQWFGVALAILAVIGICIAKDKNKFLCSSS